MLFLWISLVKIFIFFINLSIIFSKFLDGIEKKAPKNQIE